MVVPKRFRLSAYVTNFENAFSSDTCNTELSGNWEPPLLWQIQYKILLQLVGDTSGTYTLTDIKARQGKLYVTANNSSANKETFFIFSLANNIPVLLCKARQRHQAQHRPRGDGAFRHLCVCCGRSLERPASNNRHQQSKQPGKLEHCGNLQNLHKRRGRRNAIFYTNDYVYLGLVASGGGEFNIIDVRIHKVRNGWGATASGTRSTAYI